MSPKRTRAGPSVKPRAPVTFAGRWSLPTHSADEEVRWPRPVRPGDELRVESEILEVRPSKSRPTQGLMKVRTTTLNQHGEAVQQFVGSLVVPRRMPA